MILSFLSALGSGNLKDMWIIYKEFSFEAAHQLPHHEGKCRRLHGHSFRVRVYVASEQLKTSGSETGMVMDFGVLKAYLNPLVKDYLDHYFLNESLGLENPTSEAIAAWIFQKLEEKGLPGLHSVEILETCTSAARYFSPKLSSLIVASPELPS